MASFVGVIADAAVSVLESEKTAVIAEINALEGGAVAFITTAFNNFKPGGILAIAWPAIKGPVLAEILALEAANPGTVIFAIIDDEAKKLATSLGG